MGKLSLYNFYVIFQYCIYLKISRMYKINQYTISKIPETNKFATVFWVHVVSF